MKSTIKYLAVLAFSIATCAAHAQEQKQDEDLFDLSLEELMNIKIDVSKTDLSIRETPAIISVVTRKEIQNMGARDLMDILNQIPGFNFGVDVQNVIGIGLRGNWGHEGKVLLMIDGVEMNETLFSTTQFGQHYDIKNIDRIEIIRGPGSSIYGGYAELGVINIITQTGDKTSGIAIQSQVGAGKDGLHRSDVGITIGNGTDDFNYSVSAYMGSGRRSTSDYTDIDGAVLNLKENSALKPMMFNANVNKGNFSAQFIYDGYKLESADQFGAIEPKDKINFNQFFGLVKYKFEASEKLTITPRIGFKSGTPWGVASTGTYPYLVQATRISPVINADWTPSEKLSVAAGLDSYFDNGNYTGPAANNYFGDGNTASYSNIGVFAQGVYKASFANLTVGARVDNHSQFGSAFSPRIGITKIFDKVHTKLLYSRAFRAPAIENINFNPGITPERTGVAEIELGYKLNEKNFFTVNFYDISINDPIVYEGGANTYLNFEKAGSRGFELEHRINSSWGYVTANYAFYSAKNKNEVPLYAVPGNVNQTLGAPGSRLNLNSNIHLSKVVSINPSFNLMGKKTGITGLDVNDDYVFTEFDSQFFFNLFLRVTKGNFDGGIGVYDILDEKQNFVQPFASGHTPIPGLGREYSVRLAYTIPFTK